MSKFQSWSRSEERKEENQGSRNKGAEISATTVACDLADAEATREDAGLCNTWEKVGQGQMLG